MATVSDLGARVLRKLRVAMVPNSARLAAQPPLTQDEVAQAALLRLGIGQSLDASPYVTQDDIASRALRLVGVNPSDALPGFNGNVFTYTQIATRALLKLGVIASDETPLDQDLADMSNIVASVHESLVALDYVSWDDVAVPEFAVEHYITMVANQAAPQYGRPATLEAYKAAQDMLRQMALTGQVAQARAMLKVAAVHAQLSADGLIGWQLTSIPTAAAEHYAMWTAQLLAPVYDKPMQPELMEVAISALRRIAMSGLLGDSIANQKVSAVHDALNAMGLVSWPISAIPASYSEDYATMAATLISAFAGLQTDPAADLAEWNAAAGRVRMLSMINGPAAQALAEQKVRAIHFNLEARGRIRWNLFDIPVYAEEPYVMMAAAWAAPEFEVPPDMESFQAAERTLLQIVMLPSRGEPVRADYF